MRGFFGKRILAVLIVALAISLWAQTGVSFAQAVAEKGVVKEAVPVKVEKGAVKEAEPAAVPPKPAISPTTEVELQRRFNALRSELLDDRAGTIEWWLAVVAIVLTFFGIVVAILGLIGFRRFQSIEKEARESVEATNQHLEEAKRNNEDAKELVEEIKGYREESQKVLRKMTAESVADEPERVKQVVEDVRENPQSPLIDKAVARALSLQEQDKKDEAIKTWRSIANVMEGIDDALAARAWFSMGFLFGEQGEWKEAIVAFDKALQLNPSLAIAFYNRGVAKGSLGQHEAAILDYDEAICLDPDYVPAYNNRGLAKNKLGQYEGAIVDFDEALRLRPDDAATYYNRGLPHLALGNKEVARRDFEKARKLALKADKEDVKRAAEQKLQKLDAQ